MDLVTSSLKEKQTDQLTTQVTYHYYYVYSMYGEIMSQVAVRQERENPA